MTRRERASCYLWPLFLYGVRPVLHALHLLRPQPDDNPFREPDLFG